MSCYIDASSLLCTFYLSYQSLFWVAVRRTCFLHLNSIWLMVEVYECHSFNFQACSKRLFESFFPTIQTFTSSYYDIMIQVPNIPNTSNRPRVDFRLKSTLITDKREGCLRAECKSYVTRIAWLVSKQSIFDFPLFSTCMILTIFMVLY